MALLLNGDNLAYEAALTSGLRALGRLLWQERADSISWLPADMVADALAPFGLSVADVDHAADQNLRWVQEEVALGVSLARLEGGDVSELSLGSLSAAAEGATRHRHLPRSRSRRHGSLLEAVLVRGYSRGVGKWLVGATDKSGSSWTDAVSDRTQRLSRLHLACTFWRAPSGITTPSRYSRPGPDDLEGRDFDSAGRLTASLLAELAPPAEAEAYLCGRHRSWRRSAPA
jgi:hypothetical protein